MQLFCCLGATSRSLYQESEIRVRSRDINASIAALQSAASTSTAARQPSPPRVVVWHNPGLQNRHKFNSAVADFDALYDAGVRIFFSLGNSDVLEVRFLGAD